LNCSPRRDNYNGGWGTGKSTSQFMHPSRIGPIALEEPLGGSADSNVLRGIHLERNKAMAVKLLPRRLVDRPMGGDSYSEDVKRLQKLVHPHIVRVLGGALDNGQPYLAMEMAPGESLRSLFDRRGRLPWETMVDLAEQICEALLFAHGQGFVHRRLTPARMLIDGEGSVRLLGFDCAWSDGDDVASLKAPLGVLNYLAPQEIRGKRSTGLPSNDLFSLGVILYEGLTGKLPWPAASPVALVHAREQSAAPRVSATVLDCPVWLDLLVARLLEVKREGRFATVDEARRAIVLAKSKVAAGMGAAQQALSGRKGALAAKVDRKELGQLRKATAARAPKDESPFYERAWFLALCLVSVLGVGAWVMWPQSEEALMAKARPLMQSELATDWQAAHSLYLDELLERFPETKYREEIEEFQLRDAIHSAEMRVRKIHLGGAPLSDADRLYVEALDYDRFDDDLTAWKKYDTIVSRYAKSEELEERAIASLATTRIAEIRAGARERHLEEDLETLVRRKLEQADELSAEHPEAARELLENIVTLYDGKPELAELVTRAREKIAMLRGSSR
jgi:serine/threonine protein kinase